MRARCDPPENTFDFQDVMVHPDYRRRGIHAALLPYSTGLRARPEARPLYCTIAPDNLPSVASFTKAGYVCVREPAAYEGMLRVIFRKSLFIKCVVA
jgi:GNAT superfamily N-acetyltransferase